MAVGLRSDSTFFSLQADWDGANEPGPAPPDISPIAHRRQFQPAPAIDSGSHFGGGALPIVIHGLVPWTGSGTKLRIAALFRDAAPLPIAGTSPSMTLTERYWSESELPGD
jgi:hypothetical protein